MNVSHQIPMLARVEEGRYDIFDSLYDLIDRPGFPQAGAGYTSCLLARSYRSRWGQVTLIQLWLRPSLHKVQ